MEVKIMRRKFTFRPTTIFWALVGVFVVTVSPMWPILAMSIPALRVYMPILMSVSWVALFTLGLALIVLIVKKKAEGLQEWLRRFLLLTGACAVGFFVSALLHNAVGYLFRVEEPYFFIMAVFVCQPGFLVGAAGSIVLLIRERKRRKEAKK
jgi:hypothetical protein